jgi:L-threonylcarbamoyladenylate synthase
MRIVIDPSGPLELQLAPAVQVIRAHGVVGFPTDTLYGLAADPRSAVALARLMQLKARAADKTVALVAASLDQAREVAVIDGHALSLARRFWPGPLTLVVPARPGLADGVRSSTGRVGVRVPAHDVAQALALAFGFPITATSANASGGAPTARPGRCRARSGPARGSSQQNPRARIARPGTVSPPSSPSRPAPECLFRQPHPENVRPWWV